MKERIIINLFCVLILFSLVPTIPILASYDFTEDEHIDYSNCGCSNVIFEEGQNHNQMYSIMKKPIDCSKLTITQKEFSTIDVPEEFSWRDFEGEDYTTIAKNQGNCGSCWDFAAMGALESRIEIREECSKLNPDLSEQYVLSCLPAAANYYGEGCWGGTPYGAYYYMMNESEEGNHRNGAIPETCFTYQASDDILCSEKCPDWEDHLIPISDCEEVFFGLSYDSPENRETIKSLIYEYGPIAAAMNVTTDFINYWSLHHNSDDYYPDTNEPWGNMLNHIIVILGWKDDPSIDNGGYWICKNSWDIEWGYHGFFNIEYGGLFTGMYFSWADYDPESVDWAPVSDAGGLYQGKIGEDIEFDGLDSVDAEGDIVSYTWDFGDNTTGSGVNPTHSYDSEGIYIVTLTVEDSTSNTATDTALVGVGQSPINIDIKGYLGFTLIVESDLDEVLTNLEWNAEISGIVIGGVRQGIIPILSDTQGFSYNSLLFGLGPGSITINVENIAKTERFIIIGPFLFGLNIR